MITLIVIDQGQQANLTWHLVLILFWNAVGSKILFLIRFLLGRQLLLLTVLSFFSPF